MAAAARKPAAPRTKSEAVAHENGVDWRELPLKDATKPITFAIKEKHAREAEPGDPCKCVVARALQDTFGDFLQGVFIGPQISKVVTKTEVIRFRTPAALAKAIPIFDTTGQWNLPPGTYTLRKYGMKNRFHTMSRTGGTRKPKARSVPLPTRFVPKALLDMLAR
jgi:hypothetical protein